MSLLFGPPSVPVARHYAAWQLNGRGIEVISTNLRGPTCLSRVTNVSRQWIPTYSQVNNWVFCFDNDRSGH